MYYQLALIGKYEVLFNNEGYVSMGVVLARLDLYSEDSWSKRCGNVQGLATFTLTQVKTKGERCAKLTALS